MAGRRLALCCLRCIDEPSGVRMAVAVRRLQPFHQLTRHRIQRLVVSAEAVEAVHAAHELLGDLRKGRRFALVQPGRCLGRCRGPVIQLAPRHLDRGSGSLRPALRLRRRSRRQRAQFVRDEIPGCREHGLLSGACVMAQVGVAERAQLEAITPQPRARVTVELEDNLVILLTVAEEHGCASSGGARLLPGPQVPAGQADDARQRARVRAPRQQRERGARPKPSDENAGS
mmetsp:Transcript_33895/g.93025  ORF Transcript_33895/g.93025 Transcript_33895/m.93025 type:complete len:230 (-) Transcript_33895:331-1020(-)